MAVQQSYRFALLRIPYMGSPEVIPSSPSVGVILRSKIDTSEATAEGNREPSCNESFSISFAQFARHSGPGSFTTQKLEVTAETRSDGIGLQVMVKSNQAQGSSVRVISSFMTRLYRELLLYVGFSINPPKRTLEVTAYITEVK